MRGHFLRTVSKRAVTVVGSAYRPPQLNAVTFWSDIITGAQAGDLAVLYWFYPYGGATPPAISGWTSVELVSDASSSSGLWTKVLTSSDVSVTFPVGDNYGAALLVVLRNATWHSYALASGGSGTPNPPSLSSVGLRDLVLLLGAYESSVELMAPSGYTRVLEAYNAGVTIAAAWATGLSGTVNPAAFSGGSAVWRAVSVRIVAV